MDVNLAPLVQPLAVLACAAVSAASAYVAPLAKRYLHITLDEKQSQAVQRVAQAGAGLAYKFLVTNGATFENVPMHNAAIAAGVNHVLASVPDYLKQLGITQDHVAQMVSARLGELLAQDPTVSVAPGAPPKALPPPSNNGAVTP